MHSFVENGEVVYQISSFESRSENRILRADSIEIHFNKDLYLRLGETPVSPSPQEAPTGISGSWDTQIAGSLGLQNRPGLVNSLFMEGGVEVFAGEMKVSCSKLVYDAETGVSDLENSDLLLPLGSGPRGWPIRLLCNKMSENADGVILATGASLTTCDVIPPHYSLQLKELKGTPDGKGNWSWRPTGAWLNMYGWPFLPLPAPDIRAEGLDRDTFIGFQDLKLESGGRLGQSTTVRFGSSGQTEDQSLSYSWNASPSWSSRRGFPLQASAQVEGERFESNWSLFYLNDHAADSHPFAQRVARNSDTRWQVDLQNRFQIGEEWRADLDFVVASDSLVGPEFFHRSWAEGADAQSQFYALRTRNDSVTEFDFDIVADRFGYAPLSGYNSTAVGPTFLEHLPTLRYNAFSRTIGDLPGTSSVPINLSWGAEASRERFRQFSLPEASGALPFDPLTISSRSRLRIWSDLATPFHWGPITFRPGIRLDGASYDEGVGGIGKVSRGLVESYLGASALLLHQYSDGWEHRVVPDLRFRVRGESGDPLAFIPQFDAFDAATKGQAAELSLRQFFLAPKATRPWADIDFMVPWYPNPDQPLIDPLFPHPRSGSTDGSLGPAEFRFSWRPGTQAHSALAPLTADLRLRRNFGEDESEETFSRVGITPNNNLNYGVSVQRVENLFNYTNVWTNWRLTESLGFQMELPLSSGDSIGRRSQMAFSWFAHDFVFDFGAKRDTSVGETAFFFNLAPRFLLDSPPQPLR